MKKLDYYAKLTIHGLPNMDKGKINRLVEWLRATTKEINKEGNRDPKVFSKRFTARLMK